MSNPTHKSNEGFRAGRRARGESEDIYVDDADWIIIAAVKAAKVLVCKRCGATVFEQHRKIHLDWHEQIEGPDGHAGQEI